MDKKVIFSGIQPSGQLNLGNYIGALKNWVALQDEYNCCYCVVDMHAITVRQDPKELRQHSLELMALYIACGIDPEKCLIYYQSHVSTHAELAWVLNCYTQIGELNRMTQFKDKSAKNEANINSGLHTYPVLMAADILLYQADLVPIGNDQKQHLELARDIAARFNNIYGDVFTIPEPYIPEVGARIMSLQEPTSKMSKSDPNPNSCIYLTDKPEVIINKFKRAVTDSDSEVRFSKDKPGVSNLISIYSVVTDKGVSEIEAQFEGKGYGDFKLAVGEAVVEHLRPMQDKYNYLLQNKDYLKTIYTDSANKAYAISKRTLDKVYKKLGFIPK